MFMEPRNEQRTRAAESSSADGLDACRLLNSPPRCSRRLAVSAGDGSKGLWGVGTTVTACLSLASDDHRRRNCHAIARLTHNGALEASDDYAHGHRDSRGRLCGVQGSPTQSLNPMVQSTVPYFARHAISAYRRRTGTPVSICGNYSCHAGLTQ